MANSYVEAVNTLKAELNRLHDSEGLSWYRIAKLPRFRRVSPSTLWRIATTDYMPIRETRNKLEVPPTRVRICADVTEEQRAALHELAQDYGMTWAEYCCWKADAWLGEYQPRWKGKIPTKK